MLSLSSLVPGECGVIKSVGGAQSMKRRLFDLGLVPGTKILCVVKSPLGDPVAYFVRGTMIALRRCDSSNIIISKPVTV